jgi:uncharacterized protein YbjT (DUF2867 family)
MILVTTAGKVGSESARLLAARDVPVRLLARDRTKAAALAQLGVEVVQGDLADASSLRTALTNISSVILVSPAIPGEELRVVDVAAQTGVEHIVKITSKASADSPIARRRDQTEIEAGIIASGLGYTFLRNNAYMQNFFMLASSIREADNFGASVGDGRVGMVDTRDVAAVASEIAAAPRSHVGATYWPTGPQSLTYTEAAEVFTKVLGRDIQYNSLSAQEQTQAMVDVGLPERVAQMNAQALSLFAQGDSDWITDDVAWVTSRPPRSFERFVADHVAAFS